MSRLRVYRWSDLPALVGVGLAYSIMVCLVFQFLTTPGHISMIWMPSGFGVAALLRWGWRCWPAIFFGALAGYTVSLDRPMAVSTAIALFSNTVEPLLTVWMLSRMSLWGRHFATGFNHPVDYLLLGLASAVGGFGAALAGNLVLLQAGILAGPAFPGSLLHWWMGDFLGLILVTPLLLAWRKPSSDREGWKRLFEALGCLGLAFLVGQILFLGWYRDSIGSIALSYWGFLFVAWAAVRIGFHGALLVTGLLAIQALLGAMAGKGIFAQDIALTGLVNYWFFVIALTTVGTALALSINRRVQVEANLRISETRFRTITDFLPQQVWTAFPDGRLDYVNQRVIDFLGRSSEEVIGEGWQDLVHPEDLAPCVKRWMESLQSGKPYEFDFRLMHRSGEYRWCLVKAVALHDIDGSIIKWYGTNTDITEKKKSEEMIWRQANFDSLTGLPNRQMFHDRLKQEIGKAHRTGLKLALMFIDLDRFKEINDTLGHDKGDILLKDAAMRLGRCVREADTVARLGGDEFTVILGELADGDGVDRVAQEILAKLSEPFQLDGDAAYVSASIGITLYPDDAIDQDSLIKSADQAMYAAKNLGRNRYSYFTPAMQEAAQARMRLANDLRAALVGQQFEVFYQPIVELSTGNIHKAEALIRWQHPVLGVINPNDFIPIAEDTGIIIEIGNWMFREAALQASQWRSPRHADFQLSVNKSPAQFQRDRYTHANWFDYIREIGLPAQAIVVEITEGLLLDASDYVSGQLLEFRDAGMQVAIDDFGTGHSSLSYLRKFDIDYLKIDRSFVSNLEPNSDDMALCEAIIVMAHKLGIKVIAEGVETAEQGRLLAAAGCDYAQGFFYSKPVPAAQFEALLEGLRPWQDAE